VNRGYGQRQSDFGQNFIDRIEINTFLSSDPSMFLCQLSRIDTFHLKSSHAYKQYFYTLKPQCLS